MPTLLLVVFPVFAWLLAIGGGLYRYFTHRFSYSSLASQTLESRSLFWGSVYWHYPIVAVLLAHLAGGFLPGPMSRLLGDPLRLVVLEWVGASLGLCACFGLLVLFLRRVLSPVARAVTTRMDWILLSLLLTQITTGVFIALTQRWGSRWYLVTAVPWFWSLPVGPTAATITGLPLITQLHFLNGFVLIALFPFTRLVHIFTIPIEYLWRPYQVVVWNRRRRPGTHPGRPPFSPPASKAREPEAADPDRRRNLARLSVALGAVATAAVATPTVWFLLGLRRSVRVWATVGKADDFPVGHTREIAYRDSSSLSWSGVTAKTGAWLRRESEHDFTAFALNCTHLGCPVRWLEDADLFMCPCHGGVYYRDGQVASGPPRQPLTRFPVRVQDGVVQILVSPIPITG